MTSSSIRSSRGSHSVRSSRHSRRAAGPAQRLAVTVAVEEVRAVDDSRSRITGGEDRLPRPRCDAALAALYLMGVGAWLIVSPPSPLRLGVLLACIAALAVASSIEFEVGPGSVTPTAPVFVACLFLVPAALIPAAAVAGCVVSAAIGRLRDRSRRERLPVLVGSAVYALGPALVFFL